MKSQFKKIFWTEHAKIKMKQYGISKIKVINLLHKPERVEQGFVPGTMGMMKTNPTSPRLRGAGKLNKWQPRKVPGEIWLMYKDASDLRKIISVWRYPGVTKPGEEMPLPADLKIEIMNNKNFFDNLK